MLLNLEPIKNIRHFPFGNAGMDETKNKGLHNSYYFCHVLERLSQESGFQLL